jgi:hypothetical protein
MKKSVFWLVVIVMAVYIISTGEEILVEEIRMAA